MNTWIVVVNFNGWEDTRLCLQSLRQLTATASVVLVDNASRENHLEQLQSEFPECHMVRNSVNGGWAGGNNTGIEYARKHQADQIILLNNDTKVAPQMVERLLLAAKQYPDYGIIGPVIYYMDEPTVVMTDGCSFNHPGYNGFFQRREVPLQNEAIPVISEVDIVNGCCMMVARSVIDQIGLIDERFFLIHEESDFCLRAKQAGFRCGVIADGLVWHKGSSTFKRTGSRIQRYYDARNLLLLLGKHIANHAPGRGYFSSIKTYWKYVYYRYCIELESGSTDSANAVLEGIHDAMTRTYGPMPQHPRRLLPLLRMLFDSVRRMK